MIQKILFECSVNFFICHFSFVIFTPMSHALNNRLRPRSRFYKIRNPKFIPYSPFPIPQRLADFSQLALFSQKLAELSHPLSWAKFHKVL